MNNIISIWRAESSEPPIEQPQWKQKMLKFKKLTGLVAWWRLIAVERQRTKYAFVSTLIVIILFGIFTSFIGLLVYLSFISVQLANEAIMNMTMVNASTTSLLTITNNSISNIRLDATSSSITTESNTTAESIAPTLRRTMKSVSSTLKTTMKTIKGNKN